MVAQNSFDNSGGWALNDNGSAFSKLEEIQAYAFPINAPKALKSNYINPEIPNDLNPNPAELKHGFPDQWGLYTAYAGKPKEGKTTAFNNKIKGNPKTQFNQPSPNMEGEDLLPADDGTPLKPSSMIKKLAEAVRALALNPAHMARRDELARMYIDIMRIFQISDRRPLNNDEIQRIERYARIIDDMLRIPVPPPQFNYRAPQGPGGLPAPNMGLPPPGPPGPPGPPNPPPIPPIPPLPPNLPDDDDDDKKDDDDDGDEVIFVNPPNNNEPGPIRLLSENEGSFSAMVKNLFPELFEKLNQNKNIVISDDNDIFKQKTPSLHDPNPMQGVLLTPAEKYGLTMAQQSGLPFSQSEEKSNFMGISGARRAGLFDDDDNDDFKQSREISQNRRINVPDYPYSGVGLLSSEESFNPLSASSYGVDIDETPVLGVNVPIDIDEKQGGEDIDIDEENFEALTGIKESHLNKMSKNALILIARKHRLIPDEEAPRLTKKDIVKKIVGDGNDSSKQYLKILKYLAVTKSSEIANRRGSIPSGRFQEDEITRLMG